MAMPLLRIANARAGELIKLWEHVLAVSRAEASGEAKIRDCGANHVLGQCPQMMSWSSLRYEVLLHISTCRYHSITRNHKKVDLTRWWRGEAMAYGVRSVQRREKDAEREEEKPRKKALAFLGDFFTGSARLGSRLWIYYYYYYIIKY